MFERFEKWLLWPFGVTCILGVLFPLPPFSPQPIEARDLSPLSLPTGRHGHQALFLKDRLYVVGGYEAGKKKRSALLAWDFKDQKWKKKAAPPEFHTFFSASEIKGKIAAVGGAKTKAIHLYNPTQNTWQRIGYLPAPRSHLATIARGNKIYLFGGIGKKLPPGGLQIFDLDKKKFATGPAIPDYQRGDHFHLVTSHQGRIHLMGGMTSKGLTTRHFILEGNQWHRAPSLPFATFSKTAFLATFQNKLYVIDYFHRQSALFDPAQKTWKKISPFPFPRRMAAAGALVQGKIYITGGMKVKKGKGARKIAIYNLKKDRWQR